MKSVCSWRSGSSCSALEFLETILNALFGKYKEN